MVFMTPLLSCARACHTARLCAQPRSPCSPGKDGLHALPAAPPLPAFDRAASCGAVISDGIKAVSLSALRAGRTKGWGEKPTEGRRSPPSDRILVVTACVEAAVIRPLALPAARPCVT